MAGQSLPACLRVLTLKSAPTVGPGPSASGGPAAGPAASERKAWTNVDLPAPENRSENPPVAQKSTVWKPTSWMGFLVEYIFFKCIYRCE